MVKVSKAPEGHYTAAQAMKKLGMNKGTFFYNVRTGKINRISPPNSKEGYYDQKEIDDMAFANQFFYMIYSSAPKTFTRATTEEDIKGIIDLCVSFYGIGNTPSYKTRLAIWRKNPYVYYVVKHENIVVGYVSLIWFDDVAINHLMGPTLNNQQQSEAGTGIYSITGPEHVLPFVPGQLIEHLFISLAVRPDITLSIQSKTSYILLRGTWNVLRDFADQGMPVKRLLATSEKQDGIRIARKLGMKEIVYPGDDVLRYELNLENSDNPLIKRLLEHEK